MQKSLLVPIAAFILVLANVAFGDTSDKWYGTVSARATYDSSFKNTTDADNYSWTTTKEETTATVEAGPSGDASYQLHGTYEYKAFGHEEDHYPCMTVVGKGTAVTETSESRSGDGSKSGAMKPGTRPFNVIINADGSYLFSISGLPSVSYNVKGHATLTSHATCDRKDANIPIPDTASKNSASIPHIDILGAIGASGDSGASGASGVAGASGMSGSPESVQSLSGSYTTNYAGQIPVTFTWSLSRKPVLLKAVTTKTVYTVERGQVVTLDATPSIGQIDEYDWLLAPGIDCSDEFSRLSSPDPVPLAQMKGKTIHFTALCGIYASLTVKNSSGSRSTVAQVQVTPRTGWKTTITPDGPSGNGYSVFAAQFVKENAFLGKNRCTLDGQTEQTHWIHHSNPNSWEGDGYHLTQIKEPGAPFDGFWYVDSQTLKISRQSFIASSILPNGVVADLNSTTANQGSPADLATLVAQVKAHEDLHTSLVKNVFDQSGPQWDPANRIEPMFATERSMAAFNVDFAIRTVETMLNDTIWESLIAQQLQAKYGHGGSLKVPTLGGPDDVWVIPSFADLRGPPLPPSDGN